MVKGGGEMWRQTWSMWHGLRVQGEWAVTQEEKYWDFYHPQSSRTCCSEQSRGQARSVVGAHGPRFAGLVAVSKMDRMHSKALGK